MNNKVNIKTWKMKIKFFTLLSILTIGVGLLSTWILTKADPVAPIDTYSLDSNLISESYMDFELNSDNNSYKFIGFKNTVPSPETFNGMTLKIPETYNYKPVTAIETNDSNAKRTTASGSVEGYDSDGYYYTAQYYGSMITAVIVPKSVTSINAGAFYGFANLRYYEAPFVGLTYSNMGAGTETNPVLGLKPFHSIFAIGATGTVAAAQYHQEQYACLDSTGTPIEGTWSKGIRWYDEYEGQSRWFESPIKLEKVVITGKRSDSTDELPNMYFANRAFVSFTSLQELVLPANLFRVGDYAFSELTSLTTVTTYGLENDTNNTLPAHLTQLSTGIFCKDTALQKLKVPYETKTISDSAFSLSTNLSDLKIPATIDRIEKLAFKGCTNLKISVFLQSGTLEASKGNISLPAGLTYIGDSAFENVDSIGLSNDPSVPDTLYIPDNVTYIGKMAFSLCSNMTSISLPFIGSQIGTKVEDNQTIVTENNFGWIFSHQSQTNDKFYPVIQNGETYTLPRSLISVEVRKETVIEGYSMSKLCAYANNAVSCGVKSITINSSATVQNNAFYASNAIESLSIPSFGTRLGNVFGTCSGDEASYTHYQDRSTNPGTLTIPNSLKNLSITNQDYIHTSALANCTSLINVEIGEKTTYMESAVFYNNTSLTSLVVPFVGEQRGERYEYWWRWENYMQRNMLSWIFSTEYSTNTYEDNTIAIGRYWRRYIPNTLKYLSVTDETTIGPYSFRNLTSLVTLSITDYNHKLGSISSHAAFNCNSIESLTLPYIGGDRNTQGYSGSSHRVGYIFGSSGYANSYSATGYQVPGSLKTITIAYDSTLANQGMYIPDYAFDGLKTVSTISFNNRINGVGFAAFRNCSNLATINYNYEEQSNFTVVGGEAFKNCGKINYIETAIPAYANLANPQIELGDYALAGTSISSTTANPIDFKKFRSLGNYAFANCLNIVTVDTSGTTYVGFGNGVFSGCKFLTSATLATGHATPYLFQNCVSLEGVDLRNVITDKIIPNGMFAGCTSLKWESLKLPSEYTVIGAAAFKDCISLTTFTINSAVTNIGSEAFLGCNSLTDIIIPRKVTKIGSNVFTESMSNGFTIWVYIPEELWPSGWVENWNCSNPVLMIPADSDTMYKYMLIPELRGYVIYDFYEVNDGKLSGEIKLPTYHNNVKVVGIVGEVFQQQPLVTKIIVPATYEFIGENAFYNGKRVDVYFEHKISEAPKYYSSGFYTTINQLFGNSQPHTGDANTVLGEAQNLTLNNVEAGTNYNVLDITSETNLASLIKSGLVFFGDAWIYGTGIVLQQNTPNVKLSSLVVEFENTGSPEYNGSAWTPDIESISLDSAKVKMVDDPSETDPKIRPSRILYEKFDDQLFNWSYANNVRAGTADVNYSLNQNVYKAYLQEYNEENVRDYSVCLTGTGQAHFTIAKHTIELFAITETVTDPDTHISTEIITQTEFTSTFNTNYGWSWSTWNAQNNPIYVTFGSRFIFSGTISTRSNHAGVYDSSVNASDFRWDRDWKVTYNGSDVTDSFQLKLYLKVTIKPLEIEIKWSNTSLYDNNIYRYYLGSLYDYSKVITYYRFTALPDQSVVNSTNYFNYYVVRAENTSTFFETAVASDLEDSNAVYYSKEAVTDTAISTVSTDDNYYQKFYVEKAQRVNYEYTGEKIKPEAQAYIKNNAGGYTAIELEGARIVIETDNGASDPISITLPFHTDNKIGYAYAYITGGWSGDYALKNAYTLTERNNLYAVQTQFICVNANVEITLKDLDYLIGYNDYFFKYSQWNNWRAYKSYGLSKSSVLTVTGLSEHSLMYGQLINKAVSNDPDHHSWDRGTYISTVDPETSQILWNKDSQLISTLFTDDEIASIGQANITSLLSSYGFVFVHRNNNGDITSVYNNSPIENDFYNIRLDVKVQINYNEFEAEYFITNNDNAYEIPLDRDNSVIKKIGDDSLITTSNKQWSGGSTGGYVIGIEDNITLEYQFNGMSDQYFKIDIINKNLFNTTPTGFETTAVYTITDENGVAKKDANNNDLVKVLMLDSSVEKERDRIKHDSKGDYFEYYLLLTIERRNFVTVKRNVTIKIYKCDVKWNIDSIQKQYDGTPVSLYGYAEGRTYYKKVANEYIIDTTIVSEATLRSARNDRTIYYMLNNEYVEVTDFIIDSGHTSTLDGYTHLVPESKVQADRGEQEISVEFYFDHKESNNTYTKRRWSDYYDYNPTYPGTYYVLLTASDHDFYNGVEGNFIKFVISEREIHIYLDRRYDPFTTDDSYIEDNQNVNNAMPSKVYDGTVREIVVDSTTAYSTKPLYNIDNEDMHEAYRKSIFVGTDNLFGIISTKSADAGVYNTVDANGNPASTLYNGSAKVADWVWTINDSDKRPWHVLDDEGNDHSSYYKVVLHGTFTIQLREFNYTTNGGYDGPFDGLYHYLEIEVTDPVDPADYTIRYYDERLSADDTSWRVNNYYYYSTDNEEDGFSKHRVWYKLQAPNYRTVIDYVDIIIRKIKIEFEEPSIFKKDGDKFIISRGDGTFALDSSDARIYGTSNQAYTLTDDLWYTVDYDWLKHDIELENLDPFDCNIDYILYINDGTASAPEWRAVMKRVTTNKKTNEYEIQVYGENPKTHVIGWYALRGVDKPYVVEKGMYLFEFELKSYEYYDILFDKDDPNRNKVKGQTIYPATHYKFVVTDKQLEQFGDDLVVKLDDTVYDYEHNYQVNYNGQKHAINIEINDTDKLDNATIYYWDYDNSKWVLDKPEYIDAGDYKVRYRVEGNGKYTPVEDEVEFTINKISISSVADLYTLIMPTVTNVEGVYGKDEEGNVKKYYLTVDLHDFESDPLQPDNKMTVYYTTQLNKASDNIDGFWSTTAPYRSEVGSGTGVGETLVRVKMVLKNYNPITFDNCSIRVLKNTDPSFEVPEETEIQYRARPVTYSDFPIKTEHDGGAKAVMMYYQGELVGNTIKKLEVNNAPIRINAPTELGYYVLDISYPETNNCVAISKSIGFSIIPKRLIVDYNYEEEYWGRQITPYPTVTTGTTDQLTIAFERSDSDDAPTEIGVYKYRFSFVYPNENYVIVIPTDANDEKYFDGKGYAKTGQNGKEYVSADAYSGDDEYPFKFSITKRALNVVIDETMPSDYEEMKYWERDLDFDWSVYAWYNSSLLEGHTFKAKMKSSFYTRNIYIYDSTLEEQAHNTIYVTDISITDADGNDVSMYYDLKFKVKVSIEYPHLTVSVNAGPYEYDGIYHTIIVNVEGVKTYEIRYMTDADYKQYGKDADNIWSPEPIQCVDAKTHRIWYKVTAQYHEDYIDYADLVITPANLQYKLEVDPFEAVYDYSPHNITYHVNINNFYTDEYYIRYYKQDDYTIEELRNFYENEFETDGDIFVNGLKNMVDAAKYYVVLYFPTPSNGNWYKFVSITEAEITPRPLLMTIKKPLIFKNISYTGAKYQVLIGNGLGTDAITISDALTTDTGLIPGHSIKRTKNSKVRTISADVVRDQQGNVSGYIGSTGFEFDPNTIQIRDQYGNTVTTNYKPVFLDDYLYVEIVPIDLTADTFRVLDLTREFDGTEAIPEIITPSDGDLHYRFFEIDENNQETLVQMPTYKYASYVGKYKTYVSIDAGTNYNAWIGELSAIVTITPKKVEIDWTGLEVDFDGKGHIPTAKFTDIFGDVYELYVQAFDNLPEHEYWDNSIIHDEIIYAGTYGTIASSAKTDSNNEIIVSSILEASHVLPDESLYVCDIKDNYQFTNSNVTFKINKITYKFVVHEKTDVVSTYWSKEFSSENIVATDDEVDEANGKFIVGPVLDTIIWTTLQGSGNPYIRTRSETDNTAGEYTNVNQFTINYLARVEVTKPDNTKVYYDVSDSLNINTLDPDDPDNRKYSSVGFDFEGKVEIVTNNIQYSVTDHFIYDRAGFLVIGDVLDITYPKASDVSTTITVYKFNNTTLQWDIYKLTDPNTGNETDILEYSGKSCVLYNVGQYKITYSMTYSKNNQDFVPVSSTTIYVTIDAAESFINFNDYVLDQDFDATSVDIDKIKKTFANGLFNGYVDDASQKYSKIKVTYFYANNIDFQDPDAIIAQRGPNINTGKVPINAGNYVAVIQSVDDNNPNVPQNYEPLYVEKYFTINAKVINVDITYTADDRYIIQNDWVTDFKDIANNKPFEKKDEAHISLDGKTLYYTISGTGIHRGSYHAEELCSYNAGDGNIFHATDNYGISDTSTFTLIWYIYIKDSTQNLGYTTITFNDVAYQNVSENYTLNVNFNLEVKYQDLAVTSQDRMNLSYDGNYKTGILNVPLIDGLKSYFSDDKPAIADIYSFDQANALDYYKYDNIDLIKNDINHSPVDPGTYTIYYAVAAPNTDNSLTATYYEPYFGSYKIGINYLTRTIDFNSEYLSAEYSGNAIYVKDAYNNYIFKRVNEVNHQIYTVTLNGNKVDDYDPTKVEVYYTKSNAQGKYMCPVDAGTYTVHVTIPKSTYYAEITETATVTVTRKDIYVIGYYEKTYDGTRVSISDFSSDNAPFKLYFYDESQGDSFPFIEVNDVEGYETLEIINLVVQSTSGNIIQNDSYNSIAHTLNITTVSPIIRNNNKVVSSNFNIHPDKTVGNKVYQIEAIITNGVITFEYVNDYYHNGKEFEYNYDFSTSRAVDRYTYVVADSSIVGATYEYSEDGNTWRTSRYAYGTILRDSSDNVIPHKFYARISANNYQQTGVIELNCYIKKGVPTLSVTDETKQYDGKDIKYPGDILTNNEQAMADKDRYIVCSWKVGKFNAETLEYEYEDMPRDTYPIDAGKYICSITIKETSNFDQISKEFPFEIIGIETELNWGSTSSFVYTGESRIPEATFQAKEGDQRINDLEIKYKVTPLTETADKDSINVGKYSVTAYLSQKGGDEEIKNYTFKNETLVFTYSITPRNITVQLDARTIYVPNKTEYAYYYQPDDITKAKANYSGSYAILNKSGLEEGALGVNQHIGASSYLKLVPVDNVYKIKKYNTINKDITWNTIVDAIPNIEILDGTNNIVTSNYAIKYDLTAVLSYDYLNISFEPYSGPYDAKMHDMISYNMDNIFDEDDEKPVFYYAVVADADEVVDDPSTLSYSQNLPQRKDAGRYKIYYRVVHSSLNNINGPNNPDTTAYVVAEITKVTAGLEFVNPTGLSRYYNGKTYDDPKMRFAKSELNSLPLKYQYYFKTHDGTLYIEVNQASYVKINDYDSKAVYYVKNALNQYVIANVTTKDAYDLKVSSLDPLDQLYVYDKDSNPVPVRSYLQGIKYYSFDTDMSSGTTTYTWQKTITEFNYANFDAEYEYLGEDANGPLKPINAGSYKVRVTVDDDNYLKNYENAEATAYFTIDKRTITFKTTVYDQEKQYDEDTWNAKLSDEFDLDENTTKKIITYDKFILGEVQSTYISDVENAISSLTNTDNGKGVLENQVINPAAIVETNSADVGLYDKTTMFNVRNFKVYKGVNSTVEVTRNYEVKYSIRATITLGDFDITVSDYKNYVDDFEHSINLTVNKPANPSKYQITYSLDGVNYSETEITRKAVTETGGLKVYYKITGNNYNEKSGEAKIIILGRPLNGTLWIPTNVKYGDDYKIPRVLCQSTGLQVVTYYTDSAHTQGKTFDKPTAVGTYYFTIDVANDDTYEGGSFEGSFTIDRREITVDWGKIITEGSPALDKWVSTTTFTYSEDENHQAVVIRPIAIVTDEIVLRDYALRKASLYTNEETPAQFEYVELTVAATYYKSAAGTYSIICRLADEYDIVDKNFKLLNSEIEYTIEQMGIEVPVIKDDLSYEYHFEVIRTDSNGEIQYLGDANQYKLATEYEADINYYNIKLEEILDEETFKSYTTTLYEEVSGVYKPATTYDALKTYYSFERVVNITHNNYHNYFVTYGGDFIAAIGFDDSGVTKYYDIAVVKGSDLKVIDKNYAKVENEDRYVLLTATDYANVDPNGDYYQFIELTDDVTKVNYQNYYIFSGNGTPDEREYGKVVKVVTPSGDTYVLNEEGEIIALIRSDNVRIDYESPYLPYIMLVDTNTDADIWDEVNNKYKAEHTITIRLKDKANSKWANVEDPNEDRVINFTITPYTFEQEGSLVVNNNNVDANNNSFKTSIHATLTDLKPVATGREIEPDPHVRFYQEDELIFNLERDVHYKVTYENNIDISLDEGIAYRYNLIAESYSDNTSYFAVTKILTEVTKSNYASYYVLNSAGNKFVKPSQFIEGLDYYSVTPVANSVVKNGTFTEYCVETLANPDKAKVIIEGINNFSFRVEIEFEIVEKAPEQFELVENAKPAFLYVERSGGYITLKTLVDNPEIQRNDETRSQIVLGHLYQKTKISTLLDQFTNNKDLIKVFKYGVDPASEGATPITDYDSFIGTGYTLALYNDKGNIIDTIQCLVAGDITGDGYIDAADAKFCNGLIAGDMSLDGLANEADLSSAKYQSYKAFGQIQYYATLITTVDKGKPDAAQTKKIFEFIAGKADSDFNVEYKI